MSKSHKTMLAFLFLPLLLLPSDLHLHEALDACVLRVVCCAVLASGLWQCLDVALEPARVTSVAFLTAEGECGGV